MQPDVWVVDTRGERRVWKTFRRGNWLLRHTICRWLARREARNLKLCAGVEGVPAFCERPEPWTVVMSWLDAKPLAELEPDDRFFRELKRTVGELHARGLTHGDLVAHNVLQSRDGRPALVDFSQSLALGKSRWPHWRFLFRFAVKVDHIQIFKLKRHHLGEDALEPAERRALARRPLILAIGSFLRRRVYRPFKHWRLRSRDAPSA